MNFVESFIESLPALHKSTIPPDESCPICLLSFEDILHDETQEDPLSGVTKLPSCHHVFCRRDLVEWIRGMNGKCPYCRHAFLDIRPPSDSDGESSDGGEYIPMDDDDEEEDSFTLDTDGFTEASDFDVEVVEDIDIGLYQNWREPSSDDVADVSSDYLTDGDSLSTSEDLSLGSDEMEAQLDDIIAIHEDDSDEPQELLSNLPHEEQEDKD
ncbi:hypothetical protein D9758_001097 [Tetrapyrgos nigripes]|uniref:RING-type domain-containing protein n=1 Tax=Tetrapyrgos nigripes TaxID=182062 RepID=A0A8H5GRX5_9AGAR|nr:hypothetical protein D9758_001097 [Tetrapyrgos nigripes]